MTLPTPGREQGTLDTDPRGRRVAYWVATSLVAVAFVVPGVLNLIHAPHIAGDMAHLGYPPYFSTILGTWKLLAAVAVLAPRTPRVKEWAYAGMMFDLTGASASRLVVGDSLATIAIPLVIACVVAVSWRLRPPARRLSADGARRMPFRGVGPLDSPAGFSGALRGGAHE